MGGVQRGDTLEYNNGMSMAVSSLGKNHMPARNAQPYMEEDNNPLHYRSVAHDKLTVDDLNRLKEEFLEQEERDRLNP